MPSVEPADWPAPQRPADRHGALAMTRGWLAVFEERRARHPPVPDGPVDAAPFPRQALLRSLATFQLGESGDGRHLRSRAERQSHPDYADAVDLFVAEEQRHARLLAEVLARFGAPLRTSHWSDRVFVAVRHLAGLRTEVLVLMAAELIALRYYSLLAANARNPVLAAVAADIVGDEVRHVAFHCDQLAWGVGAWPPGLRRLVAVAWRSFLTTVAWVVAWDHRAVIRAGGGSIRGFVAACGCCFDEAYRRIFAS